MPDKRLHLTCLFSDDMRREAGGQTTLVGWYTSGVLQLPAPGAFVFPKFCINCVLEVSTGRKVESLSIEVRHARTTLQKIELPSQALISMQQASEQTSNNDIDLASQVNIAFQFGNFTVPGPGIVRVHAFADMEEVVSNGLRLLPVSSGTNVTTTGTAKD